MKHGSLFLLFVAVCLQAQDGAKPDVQQSQHETGDYYGAYSPGGESVFNHHPNAFLVECVRNRKSGKALDVGMGSGRNALYLASHGWDVTGFDIANVGYRPKKGLKSW